MQVCIVICMHEKHKHMQERICMKCPHTSHVEVIGISILKMHKLGQTKLPQPQVLKFPDSVKCALSLTT